MAAARQERARYPHAAWPSDLHLAQNHRITLSGLRLYHRFQLLFSWKLDSQFVRSADGICAGDVDRHGRVVRFVHRRHRPARASADSDLADALDIDASVCIRLGGMGIQNYIDDHRP